ncbi:MAG TPA: hypothetical protein VG435_18770 [Acidimicrobiales bacterium]|jgi:hypothetical protein|nr:hypothetical protein [Acidimicrobiales bacterium]
MPGNSLRQQYFDMIMDQVRSNRFPSPTMLDRIEQSVGDRDAAEEYIRSLIDKLSDERFPSPVMLDRLSGLLDILDSRQ